MAAALARASSFAGQRRDSALAEMMEVRGGRVAPEASAFPGVPGCMHGLRGRVGRKTRCFFTDFALMIKFYGEGDCHILRVIVINSRTLHIKRVCPRTGPCCTAALVGAVTPATTKLHHAAPRLATRAAPGRAPEVHGRDDAPRRVDLEPREQVHRCGAARGTKAAFFSLESETPSSGSDAVEPTPRKRAVPPPTPSKAEASSFTQAGTTALYLRKVMKKQRRPGDWWLPKASNSTSRSPPP